jgi:hypothetical protein
MLWEKMMSNYIPPEYPCKLQVVIKDISPWRWKRNSMRKMEIAHSFTKTGKLPNGATRRIVTYHEKNEPLQ